MDGQLGDGLTLVCNITNWSPPTGAFTHRAFKACLDSGPLPRASDFERYAIRFSGIVAIYVPSGARALQRPPCFCDKTGYRKSPERPDRGSASQ